jgi:hypothetical protein
MGEHLEPSMGIAMGNRMILNMELSLGNSMGFRMGISTAHRAFELDLWVTGLASMQPRT